MYELQGQSIILWGGTGQAKVVRPIIEARGGSVVAVFDDTPGLPPPFPDVPLYLGWKGFCAWRERQDGVPFGFCIAIGNPHGRVRLKIAEQLKAAGLHPVHVIHPTAHVEANAQLGEGCQLMAGALVGAEAVLGAQVIINTRASVDHECILGDGCELAPGATLCGLIRLGDGAWVGAGTTVLPRLNIGRDSIVGAGSLVINDIPDGVVVVGHPATRVLRKV